MSSLDSYNKSPYSSLKHSTYFQVYDELFDRFRGKEITFVEVGVLSGGSLFMWRDYFGPKARIIGVDIDPNAKKWEAHGFEIFIGSQESETFWLEFQKKVGDLDILLDDGGHTYDQQIVTASVMMPSIKDGGLIVIEDTHTSYMDGFGDRKATLMHWVYAFADGINKRFSGLLPSAQGSSTSSPVWRVSTFESIVCLHVDRVKAQLRSVPVVNGGQHDSASDLRYADDKTANRKLEKSLRKFKWLTFIPLARHFHVWSMNLMRAKTSKARKHINKL